MANETMRIFFPLKVVSYPQYDCSDEKREDISPREAVAYEDQILAAIAKENRHFENGRGLVEYIHDEALREKRYSLYPSVEVVDGELWGVMTAGLKEPLSGEETAALMDYVCGQKVEIISDRIEITSAGGSVQGMTEEEFFSGYSAPRNKELMRVFKDMHLVEQLGSGMIRILKKYDRSIFTITPNFIKVAFPFLKVRQDGG